MTTCVFLLYMSPFYSVYFPGQKLSSSNNNSSRGESNVYLCKCIHSYLYVMSPFVAYIAPKWPHIHDIMIKPQQFFPVSVNCFPVSNCVPVEVTVVLLREVGTQKKPEICGIIWFNAKAPAPCTAFLPRFHWIKDRGGWWRGREGERRSKREIERIGRGDR